jgi:hypothetical protein
MGHHNKVAKFKNARKLGIRHAQWRKRTNVTAKVGAPIAAGVVAGPAGSAGALVVIHRSWIKQHIFHRTHEHA